MAVYTKSTDQLLDESPDIEYSVEIDDCCFDHTSNHIKVIGKLKSAIRYDLKKLMESNLPKHKEILKSLVINAAEKNLWDGFKCLLYRNYQISPLNDKNQTVLHLAFYHGSKGIIFELADYLESESCEELELTDYTDVNGLTHLHVACAMGNMKLIDKYSENSSNINARYISSNKYDKHPSEFTPLQLVMTNHKNYNKDIVELLIKRGADVNAVDDLGRTPLHIASSFSNSASLSKNSLQVMKALVNSKADIDAKDVDGNTPLLAVFPALDERTYYIEEQNFIKVIEETEQKLKLLFEGGADLNAKNKNNNTVLHLTMGYLKIMRQKSGFDDSRIIKILQLLMSYNPDIDVNIMNNFEQTPLSLAILYLSNDISKFFLEHNATLDGIKFNSNSDTFFKYPYGILTLEPLQKLIDILELLSGRGLILTPEDNLVVLKFLTCERKSFGIRNYDFKSDLFHMMCIESSNDLKKILGNFNTDFDYDYSECYGSSEEYLDHYDNLNEYSYCITEADVFIGKGSKALIKKTLDRCNKTSWRYSPRVDVDDIYEELQNLESITPVADISLAEILMDKPKETALCFGQNNFDASCLKSLDRFYGIAKGHITISLIRYHVIEQSYNIVKNLHFATLPYDCYELISNYLSNKDIINLCLAILK